LDRTGKEATLAALAVATLVTFLVLGGMAAVSVRPAAAALATVGQAPTACSNLYSVRVTNATVSYGGKIYSPFDDPNETITMTYGSFYEVSLQGYAAPRSNSSTIKAGALWYSTTAGGNETSQVCTSAVYTPNAFSVVTDYETTGFSVGPQGGQQSVAYVLFNGCYKGECGHYVYSDPTIWFKIDWLPENYTGHTSITTTTTTSTATVTNTSTRTSTVTSTSTQPASTTTQTATSVVTSTPQTSTLTATATVISTATTVVTSSVTTTSTAVSINTTAEYGLGIVAAIIGISVVAVTILRIRHEAAYRKASP
jgi:hypothetical protein